MAASSAADFGLRRSRCAVGRLSVGERQRVEILKALYRDARILILDEPTAVLTPQEASRCSPPARKWWPQGLAIVFISHKLGEVLAIADRVVVLRAATCDAAGADARRCWPPPWWGARCRRAAARAPGERRRGRAAPRWQ
jgi:ABC-type uncharacterized transport system ATPase subunit